MSTTTTTAAATTAVDAPDDAWNLIICVCLAKTLAVLAQLNSHFRTLSLPHLIANVTIKNDTNQLASFLSFILNRKDEAGTHVKTLKIEQGVFDGGVKMYGRWFPNTRKNKHTPISPSKWALMLTDALRCMSNLQSLTLDDQVEELVAHSPQFLFVLFTRPCLTTLSLGKIAEGASKALGEACSALPRNLKLQVVSLHGVERTNKTSSTKQVQVGESEEDLGYFIRHLRQHLTTLNLSPLDLTEFAWGKSGPFPSLGKLCIDYCIMSLTTIATGTLPALHTLDDQGAIFPAQPPLRHIAFPRLVTLRTVHVDLMAMMVSNGFVLKHVRFLAFKTDWGVSQGKLGDTRLSLSIVKGASGLRGLFFRQCVLPPDAVKWWKDFGRVMPTTLKHLRVVLSAESKDQAQIVINGAPQGLAPSWLEHVTLEIETYKLPRVMRQPKHFGLEDEEEMLSEGKVKPFSKYIEESIALSWARKIPTLRYIDVQKRLESALEPYPDWRCWFRVERDGGIVSVKSLDTAEGTRITRSYDGGLWTEGEYLNDTFRGFLN